MKLNFLCLQNACAYQGDVRASGFWYPTVRRDGAEQPLRLVSLSEKYAFHLTLLK